MNTKNFDPYDFSKKVVDGVNIYYKNLPSAPCININLIFDIGAFYDPKGKEGVSHFLEHMIFNGSPEIPDKKAVREWSKLNALNSWNAWTSTYQTNYHLRCFGEKYSTVINGMISMVFRPLLKVEDVEHERKVITQEAWSRYKNEKFLKYVKEFNGLVFSKHNFSRIGSPLGWPDTVADISKEDIDKWHKETYVKENLHFVITGAITEENIEELSKLIKSLPEGKKKDYSKGDLVKPLSPSILKNSEEIGDPREQAEVGIMRVFTPVPEEVEQVGRLSRSLLADLLHERLRIEKSLCYSVSTQFFNQKDYAQISMTIMTSEEHVELVQKEFWSVVEEIKSGKYKEKFKVVKNVLLEQIRSRELLSEDVANASLKELNRFGRIVPTTEEVKYVEKVAHDEVVDFLSDKLKTEFMFTEVILPAKKV